MSGFSTEVRVYPGYDERDDPEGKRGAHNLSVDFILTGPDGAVNWVLNTGWVRRPLTGPFVRGRQQERRRRPGADYRLAEYSPSAGAVSSHLPVKREDYMLGPTSCPILGGECYGDAGYTAGDELLEAMFEGGHEAVWAKLREFYDAWVLGYEGVVS